MTIQRQDRVTDECVLRTRDIITFIRVQIPSTREGNVFWHVPGQVLVPDWGKGATPIRSNTGVPHPSWWGYRLLPNRYPPPKLGLEELPHPPLGLDGVSPPPPIGTGWGYPSIGAGWGYPLLGLEDFLVLCDFIAGDATLVLFKLSWHSCIFICNCLCPPHLFTIVEYPVVRRAYSLLLFCPWVVLLYTIELRNFHWCQSVLLCRRRFQPQVALFASTVTCC